METVYGCLVWIALGGCGALLWMLLNARRSLEAEITQLGRKAITQEELASAIALISKEMQRVSAGVSQELEGMKSEVSDLKKKAEPADMIPESLGLNLNTRGQILRLYRRGESVSDIASTLHVPKGEVNLIIRVHEMSRVAWGDSSFEMSA